MANSSLEEAVSNAVKEHAGPDPAPDPVPESTDKKVDEDGKGTEGKDKAEEKTTVDKVRTEELDGLEEFKGVDPARIRAALDLVSQFNDPKNPNAREITRKLAEYVGLEVQSSNGTTKEATKSVLDDFKDSLPDDYKFLGDAIGPAIEKAIAKHFETKIKPIEFSVEQQQEKQVKIETSAAIERMRAAHKDFKELEPEIDKLGEVFDWNPEKLKLDDYLEKLYKMAAVEKSESRAVKNVTDRINKNAKEALPPPSEVTDDRVRRGSKLPTLHEAIQAGVRGEKLQ